jgi:hypothetical protein
LKIASSLCGVEVRYVKMRRRTGEEIKLAGLEVMNRRRDLGLCSTPGMISAYLLEESVHVRLSAKTFVEQASLGELEIITGTGGQGKESVLRV